MRFRVLAHDAIKSIDASDWNACAFPTGDPYQPFVDHQFLNALELSGCVSAETGWRPLHLELKLENDTVGVVPLYLKSHSQGEYVFDHAWAEACYRANGRYYPKLQVCVPFTPVTGARILTSQTDSRAAVESRLFEKIVESTHKLNVSSVHITFLEENQWSMAGSKFLQRMDVQFHWQNEGYTSFDDFVSVLTSKKRKNIRRERRTFRESDFQIEWLSGSDLRECHWDAFYDFYVDTSSRKWGNPYLNREFFSQVSATMSENILLILCRRGPKYIAGALNFIGDQTLYGRNWGCIEHYPFLHFEVCYYQAMEYAIQHQLQTLEAGVQGGHKFVRGYQSQPTYSAHYFANEQFHAAVASFLAEERKNLQHHLDYLETHSPFKERDLIEPQYSETQSDTTEQRLI